MSNEGKKVSVHYTGTLDDGTVFDSSKNHGQPLEFTCMAGQMIPGFDKAVKDMEVGQTVNVHLSADEAYGPEDPNAYITIPLTQMPGVEELNVDDKVVLGNPMGQQFPVVVSAKDAESITFNANHELAGKELNFEITLLSAE